MAADTTRGAVPQPVVHLAWELSIPTETLAGALAAHGLHVVTAADKAVLDASAAIVVDNLVHIAERNGRRMARWARAELARRNGGRVLARREAAK